MDRGQRGRSGRSRPPPDRPAVEVGRGGILARGLVEPERQGRLEGEEVVEVRIDRKRPRLPGRTDRRLEVAVAGDDHARHGPEPGELAGDLVELGRAPVGRQVAGDDDEVGLARDRRIDQRPERPPELRRAVEMEVRQVDDPGHDRRPGPRLRGRPGREDRVGGTQHPLAD